jgi:hypothetical protein
MDNVLGNLAGLVGVFIVLSLVVEKINDLIKLRNPALSVHKTSEEKEKERERDILFRNILVGIGIALVLKADAMQILISGEGAEVIGWEKVFFLGQPEEEELTAANFFYFENLAFRNGAGMGLFAWLFALVGIATTGVALSFGSKFWHDVLGIIYELKEARASVRRKLKGRK